MAEKHRRRSARGGEHPIRLSAPALAELLRLMDGPIQVPARPDIGLRWNENAVGTLPCGDGERIEPLTRSDAHRRLTRGPAPVNTGIRVGDVEILARSDGTLEFDRCNFFPHHPG